MLQSQIWRCCTFLSSEYGPGLRRLLPPITSIDELRSDLNLAQRYPVAIRRVRPDGFGHVRLVVRVIA